MSCNRCAVKSSNAAASVAAAPHIESKWATIRNQPQQCLVCRGFLRSDGGCTKCENNGNVVRPSLHPPRQKLESFLQKYPPDVQEKIKGVLAQTDDAGAAACLPHHLCELNDKVAQLGLTDQLTQANDYIQQQTGQRLILHDARRLLEMPTTQWNGYLTRLASEYSQPVRRNPAHNAIRLPSLPDTPKFCNQCGQPLQINQPHVCPRKPMSQSQVATRPVKRVQGAFCQRHQPTNAVGRCPQCKQELQELDREQKLLYVYRGSRYLMVGVNAFFGTVISGPVGGVILGGLTSLGTGPMKRLEDAKRRFYAEERERILRGEPTPPDVDEHPGFTWLPRLPEFLRR